MFQAIFLNYESSSNGNLISWFNVHDIWGVHLKNPVWARVSSRPILKTGTHTWVHGFSLPCRMSTLNISFLNCVVLNVWTHTHERRQNSWCYFTNSTAIPNIDLQTNHCIAHMEHETVCIYNLQSAESSIFTPMCHPGYNTSTVWKMVGSL